VSNSDRERYDHVRVDGTGLELDDLAVVARRKARVELAPEARHRMAGSRRVIEEALADQRLIYGVTTGFGRLCEVALPASEAGRLQENLILSHAAGVGEPFAIDVVRGMLLLRANALAAGFSGVRPRVVETLIEMLNRGVHPVVPQQGSLGASGDLAPLAHLALVAIGGGLAFGPDGEPRPGREVMAQAGLEPLTLEAKEGLALINGTQAMTAVLGLALVDAFTLVRASTAAACLTLEALRGISDAFDPRVSRVRPHPGQVLVSEKVRALTDGSGLITRGGELRVQDAYSLRCVPQVHGACLDALAWARGIVEKEMNAVTDNPLVFPHDGGGKATGEGGRSRGDGVAADGGAAAWGGTAGGRAPGEVISGGNFHGEPVAMAGDLAAIAVAELASMSERRTARLVDPAFSEGLPAFLTPRSGLNSGLMLAQYTAAALVSENKTLAVPAVVDSIPSSAGQEDHVSMGTIAARKARAVVGNTARVVAVELLAAAQAVDLRSGLDGAAPPGADPEAVAARLGKGTRTHYLRIRRAVPYLSEDQVLSGHIETLAALVLDGEFGW